MKYAYPKGKKPVSGSGKNTSGTTDTKEAAGNVVPMQGAIPQAAPAAIVFDPPYPVARRMIDIPGSGVIWAPTPEDIPLIDIRRDYPSSEFVLICPEVFVHFHSLVAENRNMLKAPIVRYSSDMEREIWKVNGESLKFSKKGRFLDGQHRAASSIRTGASIITNVVYGLDEGVMDSIDIGARRTPGDFLAILGYRYPSLVGSISRWLLAFQKGLNNTNSGRFTQADVLRIAERHPNVQESIIKGHRPLHLTPSFLSALHYTASELLGMREEADAFLKTFIDGTQNRTFYPNDNTDPALKLVIKFTREAAQEKKRTPTPRQIGMAIAAWNLYAKHKPLNREPTTPKENVVIEGLNPELI